LARPAAFSLVRWVRSLADFAVHCFAFRAYFVEASSAGCWALSAGMGWGLFRPLSLAVPCPLASAQWNHGMRYFSADPLGGTAERAHSGLDFVQAQANDTRAELVGAQPAVGDHLPDGAVGDAEVFGGLNLRDLGAFAARCQTAGGAVGCGSSVHADFQSVRRN
jgi:hypothetical protein